MSWVQGVGCVFLANALVLAPLVAIGHAGVKYGVRAPGLPRAAGPALRSRAAATGSSPGKLRMAVAAMTACSP